MAKFLKSFLGKETAFIVAAFLILIVFLFLSREPLQVTQPSSTPVISSPSPSPQTILKILKDVGEPFYDHFGLVPDDFRLIKEAGFDVIEGNFDICASSEDVEFFLDQAQNHGLKVILNAGAGEAEWGYPCDESFSPTQRPIWQKEKVRQWVNKWRQHPAILAWDISNEAGANFPNGAGGVRTGANWEKEFALTLEQLQQAFRDVKTFDPNHEIMIRMNGWYFYDYEGNFFRPGNPFDKGVADIVMINAYSNVEDYYSDFVATVLARATKSIFEIEPKAKIIVALGAWEEPPLWKKPEPTHLLNDYEQALRTRQLLAIAFFKYGAREGNGWWLPDRSRGSAELWELIRKTNKVE